MKEKELREAYVKTAESYIGKKAGSVEHKFIVDTYNKIKPLPRNYKVTYADSWCATFVSAMAKLCGIEKIVPAECSCENQIELFKKNGAWVEMMLMFLLLVMLFITIGTIAALVTMLDGLTMLESSRA